MRNFITHDMSNRKNQDVKEKRRQQRKAAKLLRRKYRLEKGKKNYHPKEQALHAMILLRSGAKVNSSILKKHGILK